MVISSVADKRRAFGSIFGATMVDFLQMKNLQQSPLVWFTSDPLGIRKV